jgi:hypothetical protein
VYFGRSERARNWWEDITKCVLEKYQEDVDCTVVALTRDKYASCCRHENNDTRSTKDSGDIYSTISISKKT